LGEKRFGGRLTEEREQSGDADQKGLRGSEKGGGVLGVVWAHGERKNLVGELRWLFVAEGGAARRLW
jgi:hypothetical protein